MANWSPLFSGLIKSLWNLSEPLGPLKNQFFGLPGLGVLAEGARVVEGGSEHERHAGRPVEEVKERLLRDVIDIHFINYKSYDFYLLI